LHQDKGQSRHRGKKEGSMTPKEAAAKCREWAADSRSRAIAHDNETVSYGHGEREVAYNEAANLIDQINQPQPWPPPEEMEEVLAHSPNIGSYSAIGKAGKPDWRYVNEQWGPFAHWLPMPPAPEVKG
jgi:hypothetical protein